jgi:hypothetical protein
MIVSSQNSPPLILANFALLGRLSRCFGRKDVLARFEITRTVFVAENFVTELVTKFSNASRPLADLRDRNDLLFRDFLPDVGEQQLEDAFSCCTAFIRSCHNLRVAG